MEDACGDQLGLAFACVICYMSRVVRAWATEDTSTLASAAIMEDTSSDHLVFACACVIFYMLGVARVRACKTQAAICLILEQQRL